MNHQSVVSAGNNGFWGERYHINFQHYLNWAKRKGYIQVSMNLTDKLTSLTAEQCQVAAKAYQLEPQQYIGGQLRAEVCRLATTDPTKLPESLDQGVYLLTDIGATFVRGHQYLLLMHQYYFPDVINFRKLEGIRKKLPKLEPWQCLVYLLDQELTRAQTYHNATSMLLLLKHKMKLYRHLGRYQEGLDCLQQILFYELQSIHAINDNLRSIPDLKRLTNYESQELHFFLEQLNLPLEDFLLQFNEWLQNREFEGLGFTRPEMISSIMFAYLEDFKSLRRLYLNIQDRNQN